MTDDEIIAVVQAHKEGKKIQGKCARLSNIWVDLYEPINWDFVDKVYRVAPEPRKPREWWILEYVGGSVMVLNEPPVGCCDAYRKTFHVREVLE